MVSQHGGVSNGEHLPPGVLQHHFRAQFRCFDAVPNEIVRMLEYNCQPVLAIGSQKSLGTAIF